MTIFSCNDISKSYYEKTLFRNISFGMEEGERVGVIGRNGVGKTSFLRIVAGLDEPDSGTIAFNRNLRLEYLRQLPGFDASVRVLEAVMSAKPALRTLLREHEKICHELERTSSDEAQKKLEEISHQLEAHNGWNLETEAKIVLHKLGVDRFDDDVRTLSGGLQKRVALARVLLSDPDLLILDEPTNHLDADSVQWLQDRLQNSSKALLLVTHDRYFLDAVTTKIVELDQHKLFVYPGNYETYLMQKEAFLETQEATAEHERNKLRTELAWLARGARARRTKQQSRIDWIAKMQAQERPQEEKKIKIELGKSFLGSKIIDANNISKSAGGRLLFEKFDYTAAPGDRIGIIGPNGTGKSTLLKVLAGELQPDTGKVSLGMTVKLGFFRQENSHIDPAQTVIGALREIAEFIDTGLGRDRYLSAKDLLDRFLFPPKQQHSRIDTLSGGERRRLELLRILMGNPNVIFLDEPTNDFDIATLTALEQYLQDFYGVLLIVSHDRAFLDKTVEHIYAFEEGGLIRKYPGNYSAYLEKKEAAGSATRSEEKPQKAKSAREKSESAGTARKTKMSFREQKEFESLEAEIAGLEQKKIELEAFLESGVSDYKLLEQKSAELKRTEERIDVATMRWLELSDIGS